MYLNRKQIVLYFVCITLLFCQIQLLAKGHVIIKLYNNNKNVMLLLYIITHPDLKSKFIYP